MKKIGWILFLATILMAACNTSTPRATNTPDACEGTTEPGARQEFSLEQITPCLNSPEKVSSFSRNNIKLNGGYDPEVCGGNCYYPAALVYQNGVDDSDGHAILQCYFLEQNGLDAFMLGLSVESPIGHNVCAIKSNGNILVLDDEGQMAGPFQSFTDIAEYYIAKNEMAAGGSLRSLKASQVTQITTDNTTPAVLGLPWVIIQ